VNTFLFFSQWSEFRCGKHDRLPRQALDRPNTRRKTDFEMPLFRATTQRSVTLPLAAWTLALTAPARCMWTEVRGNNAVLPLLRHSRSRLNKTHSFTKTGSGQMKKRKKGFKSGTLRGGVFCLNSDASCIQLPQLFRHGLCAVRLGVSRRPR
jgi:hypothetical protein